MSDHLPDDEAGKPAATKPRFGRLVAVAVIAVAAAVGLADRPAAEVFAEIRARKDRF